MLKSSPARGFYPDPHHYLDFFPRTHSLLHPLKSVGRMPLSLPAGAPPFLGQSGQHGSLLHEHMLSVSYLSQMLPGHPLLSKPEELAAVVTEHAAGPLSSDFSGSPSSDRSSSSSSPPKQPLPPTAADLSPGKPSFNFSEEDLFTVLYGYSGGRERRASHAISGVSLPEKTGTTSLFVFATIPYVARFTQTGEQHMFGFI